MELIGEKAIKLALPEHLGKLVTEHITQSKIVNTKKDTSDVVVYWGLDEMTKLNKLMRLKANLPSPIRRDYSYPGLYKPFDHQATTAEFLSINEKAFCFNEAGTGKTSSALWAADYLMTQGKVKKVLIICPLSIMYSAWQGDVFNTCMHRSSVVCYGTAHKRKTIIEGDYDFNSMESGSFEEIEMGINSEFYTQAFEDLFQTLTKREADVLKRYYGFDGFVGGSEDGTPTLEEIGEEFDLTRERARQIKVKALRRLRHSSRSKFLRYFEEVPEDFVSPQFS